MKASRKIFLAVGLTLLLAEAAAAERVQRSLDAAPDGVVTIDNTAGTVEVRGWSRNTVEVVGDLGRDVEELLFERSGKEVRIQVRTPRGNNRRIASDLRVRVPEGSSINVSGVSTDVEIRDVRGDLRVNSVSGDIDTFGVERDIDVSTVSGDLKATGRNSNGNARFNTVSGDVDARNFAGSINGNSVSGDIIVRDSAFQRAQLNTTSGDVVFHAGLANNGRLDIETINGDLDVKLQADVSARFDIETFSGRIRNCFGPDPARTSRFTPGSELKFTEGDGAARVTVRTLSGDVRLCRD